ncbi:hypothetical protein BDV96DRAFT_100871 [Lophiotrema nucula]|uniref:Uncharacterized protein n=1 Tax=Lophiotrema nucula TaxID=690887 RepID=A0A6A5Z843_9PLEO|nr:hypothetical protein BDV96DRAFT_100871 [Lophiotrema nucula]
MVLALVAAARRSTEIVLAEHVKRDFDDATVWGAADIRRSIRDDTRKRLMDIRFLPLESRVKFAPFAAIWASDCSAPVKTDGQPCGRVAAGWTHSCGCLGGRIDIAQTGRRHALDAAMGALTCRSTQAATEHRRCRCNDEEEMQRLHAGWMGWRQMRTSSLVL